MSRCTYRHPFKPSWCGTTAPANLQVRDSNAFEVDILTAKALNNEVAELDFWRKKGPVGKLHNIVSYIQGSSQQQMAFTVYQIEQFDFKYQFQVIQDNLTCWNSTYDMIDQALYIRNSIDLYIL